SRMNRGSFFQNRLEALSELVRGAIKTLYFFDGGKINFSVKDKLGTIFYDSGSIKYEGKNERGN
ncbi:MAG: hypothetical protein ACRDDY_01750, partial [Clostridium sp.]|uniref:hypothetical protein n=1 Tax=Clostridium sp. TaxID=1506 RepID=UPI003EE4E2B6